MKKLVLFAAVAVAISFASCGNKAEQPATEAEEVIETTTEEVVPEVVETVDSTATAVVDSAAAVVEEVAAQ